ncbi:MAG: DUF3299 domain-containing protein [Pseudomonadota bacterium]
MRILFSLFTILLFLGTAAADDTTYRTLQWQALMPEGEWERVQEEMRLFFENQNGAAIAEGSSLDEARQFGSYRVVEALNDQKVRLPGFIVPLEYTADRMVSEFLLVPYFGACLHSPPPPPNQIVFVDAAEPIVLESLWKPIWTQGTLVTEKKLNGLGDAAYTLRLEGWELYEPDR